jgi:hypothetical protein
MTSEARAALREKIIKLYADKWGVTDAWLADAAIDVVLEEAAKVAEAKADEWSTEWRKGLKCDIHLEGKSDGADDVAAAIRAMKSSAASSSGS